jgi:group I intron endonuclease
MKNIPKKPGIYKLTNKINNKIYIGKSNNLYKRIIIHRGAYYNSLICRAIRKYGLNNFEWEVLYQSINRDHTLNVMEPYFIEEYRTFYT